MTILVTGSGGQVGWELRRTLAPLGPVRAVDVEEVRLQDADAVRRLIRDLRPTLTVNAAAYTAVDGAEEEPGLAEAVNASAPGVIAEEMGRLGGALVHYSTDYVFDGAKAGPYREEDSPRPLGVYGATKLAGEEAVRAAGAAHLILRTSWVYGARGRNFLRTVLERAAAGQPLRVVDDQHGAPTWSRMLAEATACVLAGLDAVRRPGVLAERGGTFHLTASGSTSWHGFAEAILALAPAGVRAQADLRPVPTGGYPVKARRPANSRLDCSKARAAFGLGLPDWRESLALVMEEVSPA